MYTLFKNKHYTDSKPVFKYRDVYCVCKIEKATASSNVAGTPVTQSLHFDCISCITKNPYPHVLRHAKF